MPGNTFSVRQLNHSSIICRKPGNPAANTALHCGKTGTTHLDPGDDFAGCAVYLSAPRSPGMGSRLAVGVIVGYSPGSAIKSWSIWDCYLR